VIVAGPATHAREALAEIAKSLHGEREVFWHALDSQGSALTESLTSATSRSALLVSGLEWLRVEDRVEVETGLNLSRDTLAASRALIVFWIDRAHLEEFRRNCPDLFHWRALLLTLDEADLPLPEATVALRRYALFLEASRPIARDLYFEPMLEVEGQPGPLPLSDWAAQVEHGCLEGHAGSGKSIGVAMYAADQARQASEMGGLLPIVLKVRSFELGTDEDPLLAFLSSRRTGFDLAELSAENFKIWTQSHQLQLVIDGFDELLPEERGACFSGLQRIRKRYSHVRTLLVSRPGVLASREWQKAEVLPWDRERIGALLDKTYPHLSQLLTQPPFLEMASSPNTLGIMTNLYRAIGRVPTDHAALYRAYVETLLSQEQEKNLPRFRSTTSPQTLLRQLAKLAVELLEQGIQVFRIEDLGSWQDPEEELQYLTRRAGLIQDMAEGNYTFSHRSLFEHFAAEGIVDQGVREALVLMLEHQSDPEWKDVIAMAASRLLTLVDEPDAAAREQLSRMLKDLGGRP